MLATACILLQGTPAIQKEEHGREVREDFPKVKSPFYFLILPPNYDF
jgi:hypothetical protein